MRQRNLAVKERIARTRESADAGLEVVVCPGTNAWGSHGCRLEMGMDNIANFTAEGVRCKAAGLLNTDSGDEAHRNMLAVSLHNLAWGAAHGWCPGHVERKGLTERFCRQALPGVADGLPQAIRRLGRTQEALGLGDWNASPFYSNSMTPLKSLVADSGYVGPFADSLSQGKAAALADSLKALDWPAAQAGFRSQMMREFKLAAQQEQLAVARIALAGRLRAGRRVNSSEFLDLARQTEELARRMPATWMLGNRPSRLRDIVKAPRASVKEYRRLARH